MHICGILEYIWYKDPLLHTYGIVRTVTKVKGCPYFSFSTVLGRNITKIEEEKGSGQMTYPLL